MIVISALGQGSKEGLIDPHGHHLRNSISKRPSTALAKPFDVVTSLGLVCPVLDVLLGDRLAIHLLHA